MLRDTDWSCPLHRSGVLTFCAGLSLLCTVSRTIVWRMGYAARHTERPIFVLIPDRLDGVR